jgi:hypothetical protein
MSTHSCWGIMWRTCTFTSCRATLALRVSIGAFTWTNGPMRHTVSHERSQSCVRSFADLEKDAQAHD